MSIGWEDDDDETTKFLQKYDDDEDIQLPDIVETAADALKADQLRVARVLKPSCDQEQQDIVPMIMSLTAKLGRISTGDEFVPSNGHESTPLNQEFMDASRNGVHLRPLGLEPSSLGPATSSVFSESTSINSMRSSSTYDRSHATARSNATAATAQTPLSLITSDPTNRFDSYQSAVGSSDHLSPSTPSSPLIMRKLSATSYLTSSSFSSATTLSSPTTNKKKSRSKSKSKKQERVLDMSQVVKPSVNDILFGKGGGTNKHPGNIAFRQKAFSLWEWYNRETKNEKERIAKILYESMENDGRRFLEMDKNKKWRKVIKGVHTKASQLLRDLPKCTGFATGFRSLAQGAQLAPSPLLSNPPSDIYVNENVILNEDIRVSSGEWLKDFKSEPVDLGYLDPNAYFGNATDRAAPKALP